MTDRQTDIHTAQKRKGEGDRQWVKRKKGKRNLKTEERDRHALYRRRKRKRQKGKKELA